MVLEECGAALAPIPLLSSIGLAAGALRGRGLVDSVLADIAGGVVATLAVHSPGYRLPGRDDDAAATDGYADARSRSPTCLAPS